jgi:MFS family permease
MASVRAAFVVFGMFWGTWAVAAVDAQRFLRVSDGQLGLLLAVTVLGGAAANAAGGTIAERHGGRPVLAGALVVWAVCVMSLVAVQQRLVWCGLFLVTVAAGGFVDVVMNVVATAAYGAQPGRLLRFHAQFNLGALIGAGAAGVALAVHWPWRAPWALVAVAAAADALWVARSALPAGERGEHHTVRAGLRALAAAGLVPLAIVFAAGALTEGGVGTWGVLFLRSHLGIAALAGASAYVAGQGLAALARSTLAGSAERIGEARGARLGLGLAAVGLGLEAASREPVLAGIGLAAAAVGSSVYWPLLLALAGRGLERPGVVVGGISAAGYMGFLAGPPVVGWVASAFGLRAGLAVLAVAAGAAALYPGVRPPAVTAASTRSST